MFTRGYVKHPCKQIKHSQGFAVRPIRGYGRTRPTTTPCGYEMTCRWV